MQLIVLEDRIGHLLLHLFGLEGILCELVHLEGVLHIYIFVVGWDYGLVYVHWVIERFVKQLLRLKLNLLLILHLFR